MPIHRLLNGRPAPASLPLVHLLPLEDPLAAAERLAAEGIRHFKVKVGGPDFAAELELVAELRRRLGDGVRLRLDANGGWAGEGREERLAALVPFPRSCSRSPAARSISRRRSRWLSTKACRIPPCAPPYPTFCAAAASGSWC